MSKLLTATNIATQTNIPESTVRRYLASFEEFFFSKRVGRSTRYDITSVPLIKEINNLYVEGYSTSDIREKLSLEHTYAPETIPDSDSTDLATDSPNQALMALLTEFEKMKDGIAKIKIEKDEEINNLKEIIEQNNDEQKNAVNELYISIKERDSKLMQTIRTIQEEKKKPWWKRW